MTKVDRMVRDLLLTYPTLYHNRFEAFVVLMTNSCYRWSGGNIVCITTDREPGTPESVVAEFERRLAKQRAENARHQCEALSELHRQYELDAERELADGAFVAKHVDLYATTWAGVGYEAIVGWLHSCERYGISESWAINNKPKVVDEEWRVAICEWLSRIVPCMNNRMGTYREREAPHWLAIPRYAKVFDWVLRAAELYETEEDRRKLEAQNAIVQRIVDEIRKEEATTT